MKTKLIFANTSRLADFILNNNIKRASVDSQLNSMEAELKDAEILHAVAEYEAEVYVRQIYPHA